MPITFLDLPPELRNTIYCYIVESDTRCVAFMPLSRHHTAVKAYKQANDGTVIVQELFVEEFYSHPDRPSFDLSSFTRPSLILSILARSKQIFEECILIFGNTTPFMVLILRPSKTSSLSEAKTHIHLAMWNLSPWLFNYFRIEELVTNFACFSLLGELAQKGNLGSITFAVENSAPMEWYYGRRDTRMNESVDMMARAREGLWQIYTESFFFTSGWENFTSEGRQARIMGLS